MQSWHTTYLGLKELPRELSAFELQAFFTYSRAECEVIDARYGTPHKLGLALHMGFLRLSGRSLSGVRIVPVSLWTHLGKELGVRPPELASLKAMYARGRTLFDHRQLAQDALGFRLPTEHQSRAFLRVLRDEATRLSDKDQLLVFSRRWLYDHKLLIENNRRLRTQIVAALDMLETQTGELIATEVPSDLLNKWRRTLAEFRPDGQIQQSWLWEAPAKHSTVQIAQVFARIDLLYSLDIHKHLGALGDLIVRRYARQLASRPPSVGARIKEPRRTVEVACFLRYCLFINTDQAILMVQRRVADLWRLARQEVPDIVNWAVLYKKLLTDLAALTAQGALADDQLRLRVVELVQLSQQVKPPSRASLVRERLFEGIRPVRSLLAEIGKLPWQADEDNPVLAALKQLLKLYADKARELPIEVSAPHLGRVWSAAIAGDDRDKAMRALEVATLFSLRRAVRNGSVWVDHSLVFRGRARLFFSPERWAAESKRHYARLNLPTKASTFVAPLLIRVRAGVAAVATAAREGTLQVDDELHLTAMPAEDEDPKVILLRAQLDQRLGEVQLPDVILQVDAQVRFSWIMLGREPRSSDELLMVYAGILAHGTSLTSAECARMIPQLSAVSIRQAMRWASDERRLSQACNAVLEFMQRQPIAATWGRSDLASSDMMSMETTKRVWQARLDPRRNTPSIGIYSHVRDRWGISYAQPFVLNERQAGVAIEGVLRQGRMETSQLAVDTHGYTDFAMMLARLLGFDLCPRLKELKQRHLFLPRVRDRWGISYAQPFVLNERQAGVAIEGVLRQGRMETSQLAVDTHGYTDFAMMLARLLGFDLCPRLKELKQRHLFLPRVRDRWGISYAQPFVLNERQAGVAIEGVLRQGRMETSQLAVDTHGYTDFAMMLARLLGFDLCPRLKELKQRHLFLPRGMAIPAEIATVCEANINTDLIEKHWDTLVHLAASVMSGNASAVAALARFGSAAKGEPVYEAGVQLGKLLRTAFLADYFVKTPFRQELRRVLNRGEAVNSLKRAIYTGRISPAQAKRAGEMQAVADGLSLLANTVMAWNTMQMQAVVDRWANRRQVIEADIMAKIAPTRLSGINLRGVFRFPVDRYAADLMPSLAPSMSAAVG